MNRLAVLALGFAMAFAAFFVGVTAAGGRQVCDDLNQFEVRQPVSPAKVQAPSNIEILGSITTVVDPDDPLVKELAADDKAQGRKS